MSEIFRKDLKLKRRAFDQMSSDREYVDLTTTFSGDLDVVEGRANLAQALINRLLTRKGELSRLGHPNYGSRLYALVGELNNLRTRGRAELYIREALIQEKRIEDKVAIAFNPPPRGIDRNVLKAFITVKPIDGGADLSITLPINL